MTVFAQLRRRLGCLAVGGLLLLGLGAGVGFDIERRQGERGARTDAIVRLVSALGDGDLALSSTSRWLRHPSRAESGAATSEVPAGLDTDPAGGLIGPPRALFEAHALRSPPATKRR